MVHRKKDSSGFGMKGNRSSPKSGKSEVSNDPASNSSFHAIERAVEPLKPSSPSLPTLISFGKFRATPMFEPPSGVGSPDAAPCISTIMEFIGIAPNALSIAIFLSAGCCTELSALALRLSTS